MNKARGDALREPHTFWRNKEDSVCVENWVLAEGRRRVLGFGLCVCWRPRPVSRPGRPLGCELCEL